MAAESNLLPPSLSPDEERSRRDELEERLRWLIRLRWIAIAGICLVVGLARWMGLVQSSAPLLIVSAAMAVINAVFFVARVVRPDRVLRELSIEALLQIFVDVTGLGMLLFFAGGLSNPFVFFFTFHVVIAAILLEKRLAYSAALMSTGVVIFLGLAEELGSSRAWPLIGLTSTQDMPALARFGWVFALGTTLMISVYMVTAIMDRLRARTADVRRLNRDLEERVELLAAAERKLAAEHQRARAILECMKEGVVVVDLEGHVLVANSAAQHSALLALKETLQRGGLKESEPALAQFEINGRSFENTISAVRAASGETLGLMLVSRDVTQRRSLERQVVHAEKLHALGNLAAGLAHELNTPLATILGYAQMLLEDTERNELKVIEEQARRCRKIVQGLLDFARKSSSERMLCSPNAMAEKVRELLSHTMRMRGLKLITRLAEPAPPQIHAAGDEIEQVLVNLVTNAGDAIEFSVAERVETAVVAAVAGSSPTPVPSASGSRLIVPRDGAPIGTIVIETGVDSRGRVVLAVEDDGPGVPSDLRDEIFEPFFTTKEAGRGTGLGLSIARRTVEDHDGELALCPRADGHPGARFELRLRASGG